MCGQAGAGSGGCILSDPEVAEYENLSQLECGGTLWVPSQVTDNLLGEEKISPTLLCG